MKRIYLSPERRPKPHGKYWGIEAYEHEVCSEIAALLELMLLERGFEVRIADPEPTIQERVKEAIAWKADYYLPIHTNASTSGEKEGTAQGPEVLAYGRAGGASWRACELCYDRLMEIYPYATSRGVKGNTAFYEINQTPMLSVYPELAFHDNGRDAQWLYYHKKEIAAALCRAVCDWYGMGEKEPNPETGLPEGFVTRAEYDQLKARYLALLGEGKALMAKYEAQTQMEGYGYGLE